MSATPKKSMREVMSPVESSDRYHLGAPLIEVDPKHLHARTRLPSIFNMAVHSLVAKAVQREDAVTNPQGQIFHMKTLAGRMEMFQFEYEAMAPSLEGKARAEYVEVSKLAAIGSADEQGVIATSVLSEGSKKAPEKGKK
jgi:hypothetical protein